MYSTPLGGSKVFGRPDALSVLPGKETVDARHLVEQRGPHLSLVLRDKVWQNYLLGIAVGMEVRDAVAGDDLAKEFGRQHL